MVVVLTLVTWERGREVEHLQWMKLESTIGWI
jgi:hypothetical protein